MFMIGFVLFSASFLLIIHLLGFKEDKLINWVRDQRFVRQQQPSDQEEANIEETDVKHAEQDTTRDSPVYVTLLDPDVLECPTCCEPLKIPIFQCDNGHLSCFRDAKK
ncbi:unnamed protein product [Microthlaspi erraticum]|uniref:E3 ubiquitin-protein ligase Sina-like RING finger domain-containing protein n=1 Tax=Microthlaspi erraticum TaxID=1685480 RepID=A0A6D2KQQ1_9BRAS|nr:unnamed protein product [Microthlaspi erraticum]